ncbi:MAG: S1 RNA-binding domain-containing protein [Prochlorotrichaceae cyanobacterium]|jgi:small subunit ribosomal protein S1
MTGESKSLSFSMEDFEKALEAHDYDFQKGQLVTGTIVSYDSEGVYVDIGGKAAALLPKREASLKAVLDLEAALPVGEKREFLIIRDQNADGQVTLSIRQLELQRIWEHLQTLQDNGTVLTVKVTGTNRGGVTVDAEGMRGFIPRSHLEEKEDLERLVGQRLSATLLEVDAEKRKVVLSERLAAQSARYAQLELGQLIEGEVTGIKPFGVFVSFEGNTGLLHIQQISQKRINALSELFPPGQRVQALIVAIDEGRGRISLSTKPLENYPGEILDNFAEVMTSAGDRAERARQKLEKEQQA